MNDYIYEVILTMPIKIPDNLPAAEILNSENIFVMKESRAYHQDYRQLKIAILNLTPDNIEVEAQILRLISNSPLEVDVTLFYPDAFITRNPDEKSERNFYKTINDIREEKFDGLIITGSPGENQEFEDVTFWDELKEIMEWSLSNVYSVFHLGWSAQAGLYYHYGVKKYKLIEKLSGVFQHKISKKNVKLLRGFDDMFNIPYFNYTGFKNEDVIKSNELEIIAESSEAGAFIVKSTGGRQIFVSGHIEYDSLSLKKKYQYEKNKGLNVKIPKNYFPDDDTNKNPEFTWKSHAFLLFGNWLNYYVYQETPYDLNELMYFI